MNADGRRSLRVLLLSPVAGRDPLGGDTSYTEALLDDPPPGVEYVPYSDAIEDGSLLVRGRRPRHGQFVVVDALLLVVRTGEQLLRRSGIMFREPLWFITASSEYDLIHSHLFPIRQIGSRVPVLSSAGYPLHEHYRFADHWSEGRLKLATWLERMVGRVTGAHVPWLRCAANSVTCVYTEEFREYLVARGAPSDAVKVLGTFLAPIDAPSVRRTGRNVAFIGRDFERKGGDRALAAFSLLRKEIPNVRLTIVTSAEDAARVCEQVRGDAGVRVLCDLPREWITQRLLPEMDVLLLPTRADCGLPYAVLESMQLGVALVLTASPWIDRTLPPSFTSYCDGSPIDTARKTAELLRRLPSEEVSDAARSHWRERYSTSAFHAQILSLYETAVRRGSTP